MSKTTETAASLTASGTKDWLYWSFVLLGCGVLTPWNALLSAIDYFDDVYPDYNSLRWISLTYFPVFVCALMTSCLAPAKNKGQNRITLGFLLFAVTIALVPIIDLAFIKHERGTDLTFALLMCCVVILSASEGIAEGSLVGLSIYLPLQYCQAYLIGVGFSGVASILLRIITKACLTDSTSGLRISACIFFFLSSALSILCVLVHRLVIMRDPLFCYQPMTDAEQPASERQSNRDDISNVTFRDFIRISSKMKMANVNMVMNAVVTLTIYPGVPSDVESDALGDWYGVMLVGIFASCDFLSRLIPAKYVMTDPYLVTALNVTHLSLIPITFAVVQSFSNPFSISLLIGILAVVNGYLFLCSFAMGQDKMQGNSESFIGGNSLMVAMIVGLSLGSAFSLLWSKID